MMYSLSSHLDSFVRPAFPHDERSQCSLGQLLNTLSPLFISELASHLQGLTMHESQLASSLQGMERRIPSFQTFIKNVPFDPSSAQKPLPPDPPAAIPQTNHLRRSSSVYTRATGVWDSPKSWYEEPKTPIISQQRRFSASSPELSFPVQGTPLTPITPEINPVPLLLEPRTYAPLLPSPSPTLAPTSVRNSYNNPHNASTPAEEKAEEEFWTTLSSSPPQSPETTSVEHSPSSISLSTPSKASQHKLYRSSSRSAAVLKSRLSRPFSPVIVHRRSGSTLKVLAALGATAEEAGVPPFPSGKQSRNTAPRPLGYKNSKPKARFIATALPRVDSQNAEDLEEWEDVKDGEAQGEPRELLSDYHKALANQYRDLAAPVQGQWDDSSDEESKGRDLRLVPAPLFWKTRQQELYPRRVEHFLTSHRKQEKSKNSYKELGAEAAKKGKKMKRVSTSGAHLKMILAGQLKKKGVEKEIQDTVTPKTPRSLFRSKKKAAYKATKSNALATMDSPHLSPRRDKKTSDEALLPLQLPTMVYSSKQSSESLQATNMKSPSNSAHTFPRGDIESAAQRRAGSGRSIPTYLSSGVERWSGHGRTPSPQAQAHNKTPSDGTANSYCNSYQTTDSEGLYEHPNSLTNFPRNLDRRPTIAAQKNLRSDSRDRLTDPTKTRNKALHSVLNVAKLGLGHNRNASKDSTQSKEPDFKFDSFGVPYVDVNSIFEPFDPQEEPVQARRRSLTPRPNFVEKALEVKREREREKRRKYLKASIVVVGRTDPNNVEVDRGRRETFGEGWI